VSTKILLQSLATLVVGSAILWLLLFLVAGTTDYWQAWVLVPVFMISTTLYGLYFTVKDPSVIERRTQAGPGAEQSTLQKVIATIAFASSMSIFVWAALDRRFGWSDMAPVVVLCGDALIIVAYAVYFWVSSENPYAGASIRVEPDQVVISTGPYAIVRHPKYVGDLFLVAGTAIGLGSWWALLVILVTIPVLGVRIWDEERTLARDLPGYSDYQKRVRHRLAPRVW